MLGYMGYVVFSDLTKVRRTGHVNASIEICLDEVLPLGYFVELEKLCEDDVDGKAVEVELYAMLDELGIQYKQRITHGYDELMNQYYGQKTSALSDLQK